MFDVTCSSSSVGEHRPLYLRVQGLILCWGVRCHLFQQLSGSALAAVLGFISFLPKLCFTSDFLIPFSSLFLPSPFSFDLAFQANWYCALDAIFTPPPPPHRGCWTNNAQSMFFLNRKGSDWQLTTSFISVELSGNPTRAASRSGALRAFYDKRRHRDCFQTRTMQAFPKSKHLLRSEVSWCDQPVQWNSVITYPKGNEKEYVLNKVRSIHRAIYPKCDVRHWKSERYTWVYVLTRVRTNRVSL